MKTRSADSRLLHVAISATVCLLLSGCLALLPSVRGEGGGFTNLGDRARRQCRVLYKLRMGARTLSIHAASEIAESVVGEFPAVLEENLRKEAKAYETVRSGFRYHLGEDLWARIADAPFLYPEPVPAEWYLLASPEPPAYVWQLRGVGYAFVTLAPAGTDLAPEFNIASRDEAIGVHEITHFVIDNLVTSERGRLPRWIEEGLCDYAQMQFDRWVEKRWDAPRTVLARLVWTHPSIRPAIMKLKDGNEGVIGMLEVATYKSWMNDALYRGSLGLVVSLEQDLGTYRFKELLRELIRRSPETDEQVISIIEEFAAKPIENVGEMTDEARLLLFEGLERRARVILKGGEDPVSAGLELQALGLFPEFESRALPLLAALVRSEQPELAGEGLSGIRWLGRRRFLKRLFRRIERARAPADLARIKRTPGWRMGDGFIESRRRVARWYGREWSEAIPRYAAQHRHAPSERGRTIRQ